MVKTEHNTTITSVIIIGTGSVAECFIQHFLTNGIIVLQQFGRKCPDKVQVPFTNNPNTLSLDADLYIIAVSDDAINDIAFRLPKVQGIIVHTAGSVSIDVLSRFEQYGVLYPLQSFSKGRKIDLRDVPFIVEGNTEEIQNRLSLFTEKIAKSVTIVPYSNRLQIHLAAVFASNFSNHMNTIAQKLLDDKNIAFSLLKPLLQETFDKILTTNPKDAQTGPAKRNDRNILEKHKEMLASNPNFQEIYQIVSKSIADLYKS